MSIFKPLFVYLQRPDDGQWVVVGGYLRGSDSGHGTFLYAPSYADAGLSWTIDPVNLPFIPGQRFVAPRYDGLHDVLRDACPDSWGKQLLQREKGLSAHAPEWEYLVHSSNADRWGALAIGHSKKPSVSQLAHPRLAQLPELVKELAAIQEHRPPENAKLRHRLVGTNSMGGARPKATVQDRDDYWLVKPLISTDTADIPRLEHFAQQWGRASGLDFAQTVYHGGNDSRSTVRVLRFDRQGQQRRMTLSGASLLETSYPPGNRSEISKWSYPRLAEQLKRIGAPKQDLLELFSRMVFNAVVGNDDDHPRNHAVVYRHEESRWRLAPAFDVVPTPTDTPGYLSMQLSLGRSDISRDGALGDALRFGFDDVFQAGLYLDGLLPKIEAAFEHAQHLLDGPWRETMARRLLANLQRLRKAAG